MDENVHKKIKITIGSTTIEVDPVSSVEKERNIKAGQRGLTGALRKLVKPGVKLDTPPGVPLFSVDPDSPWLIIRDLDGKREYGTFVKGKFKPYSK